MLKVKITEIEAISNELYKQTKTREEHTVLQYFVERGAKINKDKWLDIPSRLDDYTSHPTEFLKCSPFQDIVRKPFGSF